MKALLNKLLGRRHKRETETDSKGIPISFSIVIGNECLMVYYRDRGTVLELRHVEVLSPGRTNLVRDPKHLTTSPFFDNRAEIVNTIVRWVSDTGLRVLQRDGKTVSLATASLVEIKALCVFDPRADLIGFYAESDVGNYHVQAVGGDQDVYVSFNLSDYQLFMS